MAVVALYFGLGSHHYSAAACLVGVLHALLAVDVSTRGKVGCGDELHQPVGVNLGIVDERTAAVYHLAQIVRGDIRGHADGNTVAAVDEQVGDFGGHYGRFLQRIVEVVVHIHCVLFDVIHDVLAHLRQAALGVSHGSGRVAVHAAEVTLAVDQLVTHVPLLTHAHQCTVDRTVAMGMILTQHVAHDARALLVRFVTGIAQAQHAVEDAAVHRLETVSNIGKRAGHNHRHGVVDVGSLHLFLDVNLHDPVLINCLILVH